MLWLTGPDGHVEPRKNTLVIDVYFTKLEASPPIDDYNDESSPCEMDP